LACSWPGFVPNRNSARASGATVDPGARSKSSRNYSRVMGRAVHERHTDTQRQTAYLALLAVKQITNASQVDAVSQRGSQRSGQTRTDLRQSRSGHILKLQHLSRTRSATPHTQRDRASFRSTCNLSGVGEETQVGTQGIGAVHKR
jgi:hypothetical protein